MLDPQEHNHTQMHVYNTEHIAQQLPIHAATPKAGNIRHHAVEGGDAPDM